MSLTKERAVDASPKFSHDELREMWNALTQYVENHEVLDDGKTNAPLAAETALEKLDAYMELAETGR